MEEQGQTIKSFVGDFIKKELDDYLHKNPTTADSILKKIIQSEKERKAIHSIQKLSSERAKKGQSS